MVLAFISRRDTPWTRWAGVFTNRVLNVWALTALAFLLAAVYLPVLRDALHFTTLPPAQIAIVAALATLIVMPAQLQKRIVLQRQNTVAG